MIPQSCSKCRRSPGLRKRWGCDEPSQVAVEVIPDDDRAAIEYYSCPVLFVNRRVIEFYRRYKAIKHQMCRTPEYETESAWFVAATEYYEGWHEYCLKRKNKESVSR